MYSCICLDCINVSGFVHTSLGLYCRDCGGYNVEMMSEDDKVYIPTDTQNQIRELDRMFALVDGRYEEGFAHGLAA